jgi:hypothetical protein
MCAVVKFLDGVGLDISAATVAQAFLENWIFPHN